MAGGQEDVGPKRYSSGGVPPRPDANPPPEMRTVTGMVAAVVATAMTVPAFIQSLSSPCTPEETLSGWADLWGLAIFIGVASLVLAVQALGRERRRHSRWGRNLAASAVGVASLGGLLSVVPFLCAANASL